MQANENYKILLKQVKLRMRLIDERIDALTEKQENNPKDWGYVAALTNVNNELDYIFEFLEP